MLIRQLATAAATAILLASSLIGQNLGVPSTSTFLRTDPSDTAGTALVVNLDQLGYRPGQQIRLRSVGDFLWHPAQFLTGENAVAVFSRSTTILPSTNRYRVPDAIQSNAPAYFTGPTLQQSLDNDIPEDFLVSPVGVTVTIPDNGNGAAPYLLVGADDVYWSDNLDPEADFALAIARPLGQELLANPGFESMGITGWTVSGSVAVTSYGLATTPTVAVSNQIQGGLRLVRGGATLSQSFDVSGNAADIDSGNLFIHLSGYFGGYLTHGNYSYLRAVFENESGGSTGASHDVGMVTYWNRNYETTLMRREGVFPIPSGTRTLRVQLVLDWANNSNHLIFADNLSARLVTNWQPAPASVNTELLDNGNFESGSIVNPASTRSWTLMSGSQVAIDGYGGSVTPTAAIGTSINGGSWLARGGATLEQRIDLRGNAIAIDNGTLFIQMAGYFGGYLTHGNYSYLRAVFENDSGGSTGGSQDVGVVTYWNRNYQTTLMRREGVFQIPAGTRTLRLQLVLDWANNGSHVIFADNLSARLLSNWQPTPATVNTELLDNGNFESGSIINPASTRSWTLIAGSQVAIDGYGGSTTPSAAIGNSINGGNWLARGGATLEQRIDLRGNASAIDNGTLFIQLAGFFGGYLTHGNYSYLRAVFENDSGGSTGGSQEVGVVTYWNRNYQTTLMHREGVFPIPAGTRILRIQLVLDWANNGNHAIFADNLSARLLANWTPPPVPLGTELLGNHDFETGGFILPNLPRTWTVTGGNGFLVTNYGSPNMPLPSVSNTIGGGAYFVRSAGGTSTATQTLDLRASGADIDRGDIAIDLAGHFGGIGNNSGNAYLRVEAYAEFGGSIPISSPTVGGVSPAERAQTTTLLHRSGRIVLPFGTRRVDIALVCTDGNGLADNLSAKLVDVTSPLLRPGTGDGLMLLSGVNALPSGGPRQDVKIANAGNLLTLRVESQGTRYNGAPLFFACNAFAGSGSVPYFGLPGLHLNPAVAGFSWLLDGITSQGPFGPPIVLPGGTTLNYVVPPGLAGWNLLFQALTISPASGNTVYATSEAHDIQFQ